MSDAVTPNGAVPPDPRRPQDSTRQALIEAATTVFAERGFAAGSVRLITRAAGANQAAITYHFGGKDGLYRAVLRNAVDAFEGHSPLDETAMAERPNADVLRMVMRQFLLPLTLPDRLGRYVQILSWEGANPSAVYIAFVADETPRLFKVVEHLVRRFLPPDASADDIAMTTFWLVQQPIAIVRNAERLKLAPFLLRFDAAEVERLIDRLTRLSLDGLAGAAAR